MVIVASVPISQKRWRQIVRAVRKISGYPTPEGPASLTSFEKFRYINPRSILVLKVFRFCSWRFIYFHIKSLTVVATICFSDHHDVIHRLHQAQHHRFLSSNFCHGPKTDLWHRHQDPGFGDIFVDYHLHSCWHLRMWQSCDSNLGFTQRAKQVLHNYWLYPWRRLCSLRHDYRCLRFRFTTTACE